MTKIVVRMLVWNEINSEHIKKHAVTQSEVAVAVTHLGYHKQTYDKRYLLVGRSGKRILAVVLKREKTNQYYVLTARDANKKERRRLYEKDKIK